MTDNELIVFTENFGSEVAIDFFAVNNHAFKIANEIIDKTSLVNFNINPAHNQVLNISENENFSINELTDFDTSFLNWKHNPQKLAWLCSNSAAEKTKNYLGNAVNNIIFDYALAFLVFGLLGYGFFWLYAAFCTFVFALIVGKLRYSSLVQKKAPYAFTSRGVVFCNNINNLKLEYYTAELLQNVFINIFFGKYNKTHRSNEDTFYCNFQITFHLKNGKSYTFNDRQNFFNSHERTAYIFKRLNPIPSVIPCFIELQEPKNENEFTDIVRDFAAEKGFGFKRM
jgi:hypothetical protein